MYNCRLLTVFLLYKSVFSVRTHSLRLCFNFIVVCYVIVIEVIYVLAEKYKRQLLPVGNGEARANYSSDIIR